MRARFQPTSRRILLAALAVVAALALAACGQESHPTTGDTEGAYVDAGPITYQVQLSTQLNPYEVESRQWLNGATAPPPRPDQEWFAIFLWAKNQSPSPARTASTFDIIDTQGDRYFPVPVNPAVNPFVWTPQVLSHGETEPVPNSVASFSPPQGQLILFKIPTTVYSNRPLTLQIFAPGQEHPSSISLDL